jgi:hypothetical protein
MFCSCFRCQAVRGFERQAEFSRAAHILGLQACSQQRASMRLLREAVTRTAPRDVPAIFGAIINGCLPQPNTVSLSAQLGG